MNSQFTLKELKQISDLYVKQYIECRNVRYKFYKYDERENPCLFIFDGYIKYNKLYNDKRLGI